MATIRLRFLFLVFLFVAFATNVFAATTITGEIYRDFNNSGARETLANYNEPPVENVTITAFNTTTGAIVATTTSDANGLYTLNLPDALDGERVRLEFTDLPNSLQPGRHSNAGADGEGTTVQFLIGGGNEVIDLPLSARGDYCGAGTNPQPDLVTSCFVFDDQTTTDPTVVLFSSAARGNGATYTELANASESGTVYGFGYHNPTNYIYFANYVRRHAGTTPNGGAAGANLDILYAYSINTDTLHTFDMGALGAASFGTDDRVPGWNFTEEDTPANTDFNNWDMVGKVGAGDVELASDGTRLFITNLFARRVEIFNVNYGAATASGGYTPGVPILTHAGSIGPLNPGCTRGVARPFALGYYDDEVYTGVLCTGENGGTAADLSAHIFRNTTLVFSMDLQFAATANNRGCAGQGFGGGCNASAGGFHFGDWNPWSNAFGFNGTEYAGPPLPMPLRGAEISRPEPLFTDIEFDNNGDLILGFRDRFGDMVGVNSLSEPGSGAEYSSWAAGDIIRVCNVAGTYVLEGDASGNCPQNAAGNGDGPNGGEFYPGDNAVAGFHGEATQGALVQVRGTDSVITSFMDPTGAIFSGGFRWINNTTGDSTDADGLQLFVTNPGSPTGGGKGNGLGDIEALCPPPPLEIGNLVWVEDIRDGVQGTGVETTYAGILLELIDPLTGNVIATTTTDATGHYYFNDTSNWDTNNDGIFGDAPPLWDIDGNGTADANEPQGIMPFTRYTVRVADVNFDAGQPLENLFQTAINVGSGIRENGFRISDSEGVSVTFTTGAFGVNNHTLDFGFTPITPVTTVTPRTPQTSEPGSGNPVILKTVDRPFALPGDVVTWTITVSNPSGSSLDNVGMTDTVPSELEITSVSASAGNVSSSGQVVSFNISVLQPGQTVTITVVTRIRDTVSPPYFLSNIAALNGPYQGQSQADVFSVSQLPETGEVDDDYRQWIIPLLFLALFSGYIFLRLRFRD